MTLPALAAFLTLVSLASQSPAEVAERERKRRAASSEKARVFTNDDLEKGETKTDAEGTDPAEERDQARQRAEREAEVEQEAVERSNEEAQWRARAAALRRQRADAVARRDAARARVEALVVDTAPTVGVTDPYREQKLQAERLAAADAYDAAEDDIVAAEDELGELEEEARRAGVPPGWLREK